MSTRTIPTADLMKKGLRLKTDLAATPDTVVDSNRRPDEEGIKTNRMRNRTHMTTFQPQT